MNSLLEVTVVAVAGASFGVQQNIKTDLRGLDYTFADTGLSENPKFVQWIDGLVAAALADPPT